MVGNNLEELDEKISTFGNLRVLNARQNQLTNAGIPNGIFKLEDLTVVVKINYFSF